MFLFVWFKRAVQLEQMDLEVREIPIQSRAMHNSRLKSYKQEVEKLEKDFVSTPAAPLPPLVPRLVCFVLLKKHKLYPISSQDELQMSHSHFFIFKFLLQKTVTAYDSVVVTLSNPTSTLLPFRQTCRRSSCTNVRL